MSLILVTNNMVVYGTALPVIEETASDVVEVGAVDEPGIGEEIVEWREEGVKHYYLGNGEYQAIVSATDNQISDNSAMPADATPNTKTVRDTYISSSNPATKYGKEDYYEKNTLDIVCPHTIDQHYRLPVNQTRCNNG